MTPANALNQQQSQMPLPLFIKRYKSKNMDHADKHLAAGMNCSSCHQQDNEWSNNRHNLRPVLNAINLKPMAG